MAGFGIATPEDVADLEGLVDGAIIGSAFLRALGPIGSPIATEDAVARATRFLDAFAAP